MAHLLLAADKVDGPAVYGTNQKKIGSIERVMIDNQDENWAVATTIGASMTITGPLPIGNK